MMATHLFVPALPTLWLHMFRGRAGAMDFHPFDSPTATYFYFARNAVWHAVKVLGLNGHEVLAPAYHHGVEIEALEDAGALVRFYRVDRKWQVDLDDVRKRIGPKTRALYLTHYAGFPGPTAEMRALADEHGLFLIEDCALSLLSADGDQPLGTTGDVGIFCLYKTLPVPDGGVLVVNGSKRYQLPTPPRPPFTSTLSSMSSAVLQNLELRWGAPGRLVRSAFRSVGHGTVWAARVHRVATGTQHFNRAHVDLGMSAVSRRIVQSQDLWHVVEARRRNYFFLLGRLRDVSPPLFNQLKPGVSPLFYPLVVPNKRAVMARLRLRGIDVVDFWSRFHPSCGPSDFPEVADLRRSVVEIPCHQDLTPEVMAYIAGAVRESLEERRPAPMTGATHA